MLEYLKKY